MLRKNLFSPTAGPRIFFNSTRFNDAVPCDDNIGLYDGATYVEEDANITISRHHEVVPSSRAQ